MIFYLGAQEPWWGWNGAAGGPLIISANRILERCLATRGGWRRGKSRPLRATAPLFIDSGAFSQVARGGFKLGARQYAELIQNFVRETGPVDAVGIQDWMCEPWILEQTGLPLEEHQRRTVQSFLTLSEICPDLPWVPTLQGFTLDDYRRCADLYATAGVGLADRMVGVGSVCRRSKTAEIGTLLGGIKAHLPRALLHGYGVKGPGVLRALGALTSCDSMAWSLRARWVSNEARARGEEVKSLANSQTFAEQWRSLMLEEIRRVHDQKNIHL